MHIRRLAACGLLAPVVAVPLSWGAPAFADPHGFPLTLVCGSVTYHVVAEGNGDYTPAHDLDSNKVFIPHAFGEFTGTLTDASGNVVGTETDPASTQGSGKQPSDISCTYSFTFTSDGSDPDGPPAGWTFSGTGSVIGQVAGH